MQPALNNTGFQFFGKKEERTRGRMIHEAIIPSKKKKKEKEKRWDKIFTYRLFVVNQRSGCFLCHGQSSVLAVLATLSQCYRHLL